jgi:hypothetical protein
LFEGKIKMKGCVLTILVFISCLLQVQARVFNFASTFNGKSVCFGAGCTANAATETAFMTGTIDTETNLLLLHFTLSNVADDAARISALAANTNNIILYEAGPDILTSRIPTQATTVDSFGAADKTSTTASRPLLWARGDATNSFTTGAENQPGWLITSTKANTEVSAVYVSHSTPREALCRILQGRTFVEIDWGNGANSRIRANLSQTTPAVDQTSTCEQLFLDEFESSDTLLGNTFNVDGTFKRNGPNVNFVLSNLRARDPVSEVAK